eukprot:scaffold36702_cov18-Tisochrysis_lutea.AAC.1
MENKYRDFNTLWTTKGAWGEQIWASLRGERACLCTFSFNASSLEAIQGQEREGCVAVPAYKGSLALASACPAFYVPLACLYAMSIEQEEKIMTSYSVTASMPDMKLGPLSGQGGAEVLSLVGSGQG